MKRVILTEAKADIQSGIAKSLSSAPLDESELEELLKVGATDLISEYGLDSVLAEIVLNHVKIESQRKVYQDQLSERSKLEESIRRSLRKKVRNL